MEGSTPQGGPSDEQVERILSGRGTAGEDAELEALLGDFRNTYSAPPSNAARARHLAAIGAATQGAAERAGRPGRARAGLAALVRPRSGRARIALAAAALLLLAPSTAAGLATAGVVLPDDVRAPFEQLGIELPNQSSADEVQAVIESTPPHERGCEFGLRVAKAASADRVADRGRCPEDGEQSRSDGRGAGPGGNPGASGRGRGGPSETVPPARSGAGGGRDTAPGGRAHGRQRADEAGEAGPPSGGNARPQPPLGAPSKPAPPAQAPGAGGGSAAPDGAPSPRGSAPGSRPEIGPGSGQVQEAGPAPQRSSTDVR